MAGIVTAKLNFLCALTKLGAVILNSRRWIIFVALPRQVED